MFLCKKTNDDITINDEKLRCTVNNTEVSGKVFSELKGERFADLDVFLMAFSETLLSDKSSADNKWKLYDWLRGTIPVYQLSLNYGGDIHLVITKTPDNDVYQCYRLFFIAGELEVSQDHRAVSLIECLAWLGDSARPRY